MEKFTTESEHSTFTEAKVLLSDSELPALTPDRECIPALMALLVDGATKMIYFVECWVESCVEYRN